jgi:hypothetical protein
VNPKVVRGVRGDFAEDAVGVERGAGGGKRWTWGGGRSSSSSASPPLPLSRETVLSKSATARDGGHPGVRVGDSLARMSGASSSLLAGGRRANQRPGRSGWGGSSWGGGRILSGSKDASKRRSSDRYSSACVDGSWSNPREASTASYAPGSERPEKEKYGSARSCRRLCRSTVDRSAHNTLAGDSRRRREESALDTVSSAFLSFSARAGEAPHSSEKRTSSVGGEAVTA